MDKVDSTRLPRRAGDIKVKKGSRLGRGVVWDDLVVGQCFHTAARTITEADLSSFCNLTWLTEELFTNAAEREDMAIRGRVVPAALVFGFAEGLLTPFMQGTGLAFLESSLNVKAPTFVGDTIYVECEVCELKPTSKLDRGLVRTQNHIVTHRGVVTITYSPLRLLQRRASENIGKDVI